MKMHIQQKKKKSILNILVSPLPMSWFRSISTFLMSKHVGYQVRAGTGVGQYRVSVLSWSHLDVTGLTTIISLHVTSLFHHHVGR